MGTRKLTIIIIVLAIVLGILLGLLIGNAGATKPPQEVKKVFVCKYVGKPNVDEILKDGKNPISVSINSIKDYAGVGSYFADKQGRSYVVALDEGQEAPLCPKPVINPEIIDLCPNLDGVQAEVPKGYVKKDGACIKEETEVKDVCPNIDGIQTTLPDGFELVDGKCKEVIPVVDVCTNLSGVQSEVPAGYTWKDNICTKIETNVPPPPQDIDPVTKQVYVGK